MRRTAASIYPLLSLARDPHRPRKCRIHAPRLCPIALPYWSSAAKLPQQPNGQRDIVLAGLFFLFLDLVKRAGVSSGNTSPASRSGSSQSTPPVRQSPRLRVAAASAI